jgi:hypothetical protein
VRSSVVCKVFGVNRGVEAVDNQSAFLLTSHLVRNISE